MLTLSAAARVSTAKIVYSLLNASAVRLSLRLPYLSAEFSPPAVETIPSFDQRTDRSFKRVGSFQLCFFYLLFRRTPPAVPISRCSVPIGVSVLRVQVPSFFVLCHTFFMTISKIAPPRQMSVFL